MNENREKTRQNFLAKLTGRKTQVERNHLGQFATPFHLASEILQHAVSMLPSNSKIRFLEPGFGTGPFYSALINSQYAERLQTARGFEIDPAYGKAAKQIWQGTNLQLDIDDFTTVKPPKTEAEKFNLIVCNPPYVRHHHLSQNQKQELQAAVVRNTNVRLNSLSGLYAYFMILSKAWMAKNGVGAWIVPSEFMNVNYGREIKKFLLDEVTCQKIHRYDPKEIQFRDVLVSSSIVFFTNSSKPKKHKITFSFGGSLAQPNLSKQIDSEYLRQQPKWIDFPNNNKKNCFSDVTPTLGELFVIKRGLATGCNSFFIMTPEQIEANQIPQEFLVPILPNPKYLETNQINAYENGIPKIEKRLFLLSCYLPEKEIFERHPPLWHYLEKGVAQGINKRYLCRHRSPWYSQEIRPPAPLLCTYMGRQTNRNNLPFRFIINHSQATAANVYLMLYPKPPLDSFFQKNPNSLQTVWQALCQIQADMLTGEGRIYGGGLYKLEPKELGNVPAQTILELLSEQRTFCMEKQLSLF